MWRYCCYCCYLHGPFRYVMDARREYPIAMSDFCLLLFVLLIMKIDKLFAVEAIPLQVPAQFPATMNGPTPCVNLGVYVTRLFALLAHRYLSYHVFVFS